MADKLLKSIKFPTLPDRYVIGDTSLSEEGAAADAKAVGEALATKADTKGMYEDLIVGGAEQLMADGYESDTEPYLLRPTGGSADVGNREYLDKIVGGTVAWNQLVSASATSVTVQSGHKYIAKIGGAWSVAASSGSAISVTGGTDMLTDLTAMFGSTIADYIYNLEQATAGAGVAWFRNYFPKDYYPYDPGTLRSVEGVSAHETVGFNQWDEEWEVGDIAYATGQNATNSSRIRSKNYIHVIPNATYYVKASPSLGLRLYDEDKNYIGPASRENDTYTIPSNVGYIRFIQEVTTYNHDICINLSDPTRNGEYEPYQKHTYPLDSSLTLRGIPKLDASNNLYYDGDVYEPDGTVTRNWGYIELDGSSDEAWIISSATSNNQYIINIADAKRVYEGKNNLVCNILPPINSSDGYYANNIVGVGLWLGASQIRVSLDISTVNRDISAFKTWLSTHPLQIAYRKETPTTETAEPYQEVQICSPYGTEEYVTTGIVPVGHETRYPHDLKKKIETAPDSPSTDGTYMMKRSGGKNSYMALPSTPSASGAYVLTVTVSGGSSSYSWTAKE